MKKLVLLVNVFAFLFNAQSQNVAINATGALPHASAGLDVSYPNKGVLIPRVNLTSINDVVTIPGAANSLLVYNTNAAITGGCGVGYYYWNGTQWVCFLTSPGSGGGSSMAWLTNGNVGTNPAANFLGTIDNQDLVIRTNNAERVRVKTSGAVEIGVANPIVGIRGLDVTGGGNNTHTAIFRNTTTNIEVGIGGLSNAPFNTVGSIQAKNASTGNAADLILQTTLGGAVLIGTTTPIMAGTRVHVEGTTIGIYAHVPSGAGVSGETNAAGPGNNGVEGYQWSPSGGQKSAGVLGYSDGSSGNGMYAECSRGTAFPLGIWGASERGNPNSLGYTNTNGYAGYFGLATSPNPAGYVRVLNDISIVGNMSAGTKSFKIDHPLDPENKYLYHSCVESPDMMNIYNGIVTTDANGEAVVKLPEYFQALNKDYRYQLTPIGQFAQCIVFKEIENNQFVIKTDKPNVKVSWQVTGVRNDPYAQKYRIIPEVEKPAEFKGTYLHPEAYGKDRTKFEDYVFMKDKERPMPYRLAKERNKEK
ncbi:MAG: hypothetical protein N3F62_05060 [Bacteroidia bacterium]|nr:hypothetical protein [Bacteroidia bacterium]